LVAPLLEETGGGLKNSIGNPVLNLAALPFNITGS
jgi:hypothetical protein